MLNPGTRLAKVLVFEVTGTPFNVALASRACCAVLRVVAMPEAAVAGSKASRDRPALSLLVASPSATCTRNPEVAPVLLERMDNRCPELSVSTVAVTPALALLIFDAMPVKESSPTPMVTVTAGVAPAVKAPKLLLQVPN